MFVYQSIPDTLELKKDKGTDKFLSQISKGACNSKIKPFYTAFLHSIKPSGYNMGTKIDKYHLAVQQNNYSSKIVNVYIVYELDTYPRNPTNNFKFKNAYLEQLI